MTVPTENPSPPENPESGDSPQEERTSLPVRIQRFLAKKPGDSEANDPGVRIDRQQAVADGFLAAFLRVTLAVLFLAGSVVFGMLVSGSRRLLPGLDFVSNEPLPALIRWTICPIVWAGAAAVTFALTVSENDGKWHRLNQSLFVLFASASLIPSIRWVDSLAVAAGLFGVQFAIHHGLKQKEAARQWVWEQEKQERESQKQSSQAPRQKLMDRYGGVAGFEGDESNGGD